MRKAKEALRRLETEDGIRTDQALAYCAIGVLGILALAVVLACAVVRCL